jgi:hydroxyacyl-ACP dehydratase HTD2-like protein with hotdog domain
VACWKLVAVWVPRRERSRGERASAADTGRRARFARSAAAPSRPPGPTWYCTPRARPKTASSHPRSEPRARVGSLLPSGPSRREWGAGQGRCEADNRLHMPAVAFSASVPSAGTA